MLCLHGKLEVRSSKHQWMSEKDSNFSCTCGSQPNNDVFLKMPIMSVQTEQNKAPDSYLGTKLPIKSSWTGKLETEYSKLSYLSPSVKFWKLAKTRRVFACLCTRCFVLKNSQKHMWDPDQILIASYLLVLVLLWLWSVLCKTDLDGFRNSPPNSLIYSRFYQVDF